MRSSKKEMEMTDERMIKMMMRTAVMFVPLALFDLLTTGHLLGGVYGNSLFTVVTVVMLAVLSAVLAMMTTSEEEA